MKRRTAFLEHLAASHFGATDAAADLDLDALGTYAHRSGDSHLDGAAIGHAAFDLTGDGVCHDIGIGLRTLYLVDVDLDILLGHLLQLFFELIDLLTALADDNTRTGCLNGHGDELQGALDHNLGKAGLGQTIGQILTDFEILGDLLGIITTDPVRVPTTGDTDSIADWISFLSHNFTPLLLRFS